MIPKHNIRRICDVSRIDRETGETIATFYGATSEEAVALSASWSGYGAQVSAPIMMRLTCPACGALHIDEGEYAVKPHHTHACQECGNVWRPAIVATVGVRFLPGFRNEEKAISQLGASDLMAKRTFDPRDPQIDEQAVSAITDFIVEHLKLGLHKPREIVTSALFMYGTQTGRLP